MYLFQVRLHLLLKLSVGVCVDSIVMSSAYVVSVMLPLCGVGMSAMYMLNFVGDNTPP